MLAKEVPSSRWLLTSAYSSLPTELYNPKAFIAHAASLRQACAHCGRFPTAASRRSLDRVSVPVWLFILSDRLPVLALVGHYPDQLADGPQAHPRARAFKKRPALETTSEGSSVMLY